MLCVYRFSDQNSDPRKQSNVGAGDKFLYLQNFINVFGLKNLWVVADGILDSTYAKLQRIVGENRIHRTTYKSAGASFMHAIAVAIESGMPDETPVYIVEDDHIHASNAMHILLEGLGIADYVTGYDHPDKYDKRIYPEGELSRVFVTSSTHWRSTQSTVLTFASRIKTLRADMDIILKHYDHAHYFDHEMFLALRERGRLLLSALPAVSTHSESGQLSPFVDWQTILNGQIHSDDVENIK